MRVLDDYNGSVGKLSVRRGQLLTVVRSRDDYVIAQTQDGTKEGLVPSNLLSVGGKSHF